MKTIHSLQSEYLNNQTIAYTLLRPQICDKTVLWLHGYRERADQLVSKGIFERLAEDYHAAILFPDVQDTYYLNQPWNRCYTEDFLISEFLPTVTATHLLPADYENTYIAGISMGGFGSLLLGSHHPECFGKIACIAGAFIIDDLLIGNPEVVGSAANLAHFQDLFGDIPSLGDCRERNPLLAAEHAISQNHLPPLYLTCGTDDLLYPRNQKLLRQLSTTGADVTWTESAGNHNWNFFAPAVLRVFEWMCG